MEQVMLSIYVPTYNHEKYIAQALDSILMQETEYSYEVLVGEDASTDRTREVLMEYEKKCPGKFQMFYRKENMYKKMLNNARDLKLRCKGKYIIGLEGDDYWTDKFKIDKQIKFLESHPEYIAVSHNCVVVGDDSKPNGEKYPECKDEEYTIRHFFTQILPGQLTTIMYRNFFKDDTINKSIYKKKNELGDRVNAFFLTINGKVYCMQETMSAYRHVTDGGSSFSARNYNQKFSFVKREVLYFNLMQYSEEINKKWIGKVCEFYYYKNIYNGLKAKQIEKKDARKYKKNVKHKMECTLIAIWYTLRQKVFKTKFWI